MPVVDLYGRNPDVEDTTFTYPYPLTWDMPKQAPPGAVFFFKPAQSSPVFGVEPDDTPNAEDTTVMLDPTNVYYQKMTGIGDLPGVTGEAREAFRQDPSTREAKRAEARSWFSDATSDMGSFYKRSSGTAQFAIALVGALIGWNVLKRIGR